MNESGTLIVVADDTPDEEIAKLKEGGLQVFRTSEPITLNHVVTRRGEDRFAAMGALAALALAAPMPMGGKHYLGPRYNPRRNEVTRRNRPENNISRHEQIHHHPVQRVPGHLRNTKCLCGCGKKRKQCPNGHKLSYPEATHEGAD